MIKAHSNWHLEWGPMQLYFLSQSFKNFKQYEYLVLSVVLSMWLIVLSRLPMPAEI